VLKKKEIKSVDKEKKKWDETKVPYSSDSVLLSYSHLLTRYEQSEIKEYKKIYYIGHRAKKTEKIDWNEEKFDNEE
jgi:hypothetical protein